jgi:hypothetical protein
LASLLYFFAGQDGQHLRVRPCLGDINIPDAGVAVGTAQHGHVDHAFEVHVAGIHTVAHEQPGVFFTLYRRAYHLGLLI